MIWDFLKKKKQDRQEKEPAVAPAAPTAASPAQAQSAAPAAEPEQGDKELEKQLEKDIGKLEPGMAAQLRNPAVRQKLMELAKKMLKDGVDIKSEKAVKNWIKDHPEAVGGQAKVETFRRAEPKAGRNDPCPCGSGKKYKKCCGQAP